MQAGGRSPASTAPATTYKVALSTPSPTETRRPRRRCSGRTTLGLSGSIPKDHAVAVSHHDATHNRAKIKHHVYGRNFLATVLNQAQHGAFGPLGSPYGC